MPRIASYANQRVFELRNVKEGASATPKGSRAQGRQGKAPQSRLSELSQRPQGQSQGQARGGQAQDGKTQAQLNAPESERSKHPLRRIGRIHFPVFSPNGRQLVGFLVKRPDVAGMVKREDMFCAWDRLSPCEGGVLVSGEAARDEEAKQRLGLTWERCIIWSGMDVATVSGEPIGRVTDVSVSPEGAVEALFVSDGGTAESLVGALPIPIELVRGVARQTMIVDDSAAKLELTGGAFAAAGKGYGKAKAAVKTASEEIATTASDALDKGSFALGQQLGKTKGMFKAFLREYKENSR